MARSFSEIQAQSQHQQICAGCMLPDLPQFLGIFMHTELQIFFLLAYKSHTHRSVVPGFGFGALLKMAVTFHAFMVADFCPGSSYKAVLAQGKEVPSWYRSLDEHRDLCGRLDPLSSEQGTYPGELLVQVSRRQQRENLNYHFTRNFVDR